MLGKVSGLVFALALMALSMPLAEAGPDVSPGTDPPTCRHDVLTGECELHAGDQGKDPSSTATATPGSKKPGGTGCVFKGQTVPCRTADGFFDAASGCYLTPQEAPTSLVNPVSGYPAGTKFYSCWVILGVVEGKPVGDYRFESVIREPGQTQTIDPRVAAQAVVKTMNFVAPQLGLSPYVQSATQEGIVNVPIWMWVTDPGSTTTGPQTKRAAIGGVAIEATGTVDRIEWSMGAGTTITCKGPGTPFTRGMAEGKSLKDLPTSPTCGYKYLKTSRCQKAGAYPVTATAYWTVHWTGGGMQGDIPLNFARSTSLRVTDLRPVLVDPDGGSTASRAPARTCSS